MTALLMSGLTGSSPLGVMASYGLLRLCQQVPSLSGAQLSWRRKLGKESYLDDPTAEFTFPEQIDKTEFIHVMSDYLQEKRTDYFSWGEDVRISPDIFREMLISHVSASDGANREWIDALTSLGSEVVTDRSKGLVKPSPFYMTAGQKKFLKSIKEIAESMKNGTEDALEEAIFGPWTYKDSFHSLGWDPSTERLHALRERAPTSEQAKCVRAAVYLAAESLPLFPTVALPNGRLTSICFSRDENGSEAFLWPLWEPPMGIDSLKSMLSSSELRDAVQKKALLLRRGVFAVYRSERWEFGQGYGIFRPTSVVWSE